MDRVEATREPRLVPIIIGWAAHGIGWAVHAPSKDEAVQKYWERIALYQIVDERPYWNAHRERRGKPLYGEAW